MTLKTFITYTLICFLTALLYACAEEINDIVMSNVDENTPYCYGGDYYQSATRYEAIFLDSSFAPYSIAVDVDYLRNYNISALEVGQLAYFLVDEHKKAGLNNNDSVKDILSHGHFIVVEDKEVFTQLRNKEEDIWDQIAAWIYIIDKFNYICWDIPEHAKWSSVIKAQNFDRLDPGLIIHEMLHAVSYRTYGDSDPDHERQDVLWSRSAENSLMRKVLERHEQYMLEEYGVDTR